MAALAVTLLAVSAISFFLLAGAGGDAAVASVKAKGLSVTSQRVADERSALGLDRPLVERWVTGIGASLHGDFGVSAKTGKPIADELRERLPTTVVLGAAGSVVALLSGMGIGLGEALTRRRAARGLIRGVSLVVVSIPSFAFAFLLVSVLSLELGWLPTQGSGSLRELVLPALVLGLPAGAVLGRVLSTRLTEVLDEPYMTNARALGFSRRAALLRFALPNVGVTCLVVTGNVLAAVVSGTLVVEQVFGYPGLGAYLVRSLSFRDGPALSACVVVLAVGIVGVRALTLALAAALDPRARVSG